MVKPYLESDHFTGGGSVASRSLVGGSDVLLDVEERFGTEQILNFSKSHADYSPLAAPQEPCLAAP